MARVARYHPYGEGHKQTGRRSPPPRWDPTPHTTTPTLQEVHDPTKNAKLKHKHLARPARYHSLWEGHEQARSARVEQGIDTAEILQQANGGREEEARATTLYMTWHAHQETSSCATIPTDTGRRGHSASTTSFVAGGVAMRVQYKQGQTAKER